MTSQPIRLLIVEDDNDDFLILQKMLAAIKHNRFLLDRVSTYDEAAEKISQDNHDVCILDYRLEGRNGIDFLKEVVQRGYTIPVIFLTGQGDYEVDVEAMQLGAADFLHKNKIDGAILERSIRYALERRKAEENRLRLAAIVESSNDAIYSMTLDGIILSWNPGAKRIYGYTPEEVGGRSVSLIVPPDRASEFPHLLGTVREGKAVANFVTTHQGKNGGEIMVSLTLSPIKDVQGKVTRASVIARDITESEKSRDIKADLLKERDTLLERLRLYLERMPLAFILTDENFNYTYWNPAAERMFGYSFAEVEGRSEVLVPIPEMSALAGEMRVAAKKGEGYQGKIMTMSRKDGAAIICEWYGTPLQDEDGRFSGLMTMAIDITERKKAEAVHSQLAAILQQTPDAVIGTDLEGDVFSWNRGAEVLLGYTLEEISGKPVTLLALPERHHEADEMREIAVAGESISGFETVRVKKNGDLIDVSITISPIKDTNGKVVGVSSILRDITERKRAEESLRKHEEQMRLVEKMNAIGRLAGGVAHDFNNLLSVIGGNAEFLLSSMEKDSPHREEVEEIQKAVHRGADLTKQLLVFGRKQVSQPQPVNLNEMSVELNKMLKRLLDANIDLAIIQDPDLKPILADPGQMQQAMMNLTLNARDAMPRGGSLIIETKNIGPEDLSPQKTPTIPLGHYVRLSVTDTGEGMDLEVQKRVFEPFFTTKAGKGTGLGLATVYGIVQQWKGHILLHSSPGMGTTFSLYFPVLEGEAKVSVKTKQEVLILDGSETILVAEDEDPVRKVLVRTLKKHGYQVLEAPNGIEALQKAWGWRDAIHLLLTDTVMPKMNGKELADELHKTRPKLKVLFISGYPKEILSQQGILDPGIHLVQKPFELDDLMQQMRNILDEK